jgi:competence protein ComEC
VLISIFLYHFLPYFLKWISLLLFSICFFFFGFLSTQYSITPQWNEENLSFLTSDSVKIIEIITPIEEKAKTYKAIAKIIHHNVYMKEQGVFYFQKSEETAKLLSGDRICIDTKIKFIDNQLNIGNFDYRAYMNKKGIYFTAYIAKYQWKKIGKNEKKTIYSISHKIQQYLTQLLKKSGMNGDEFAVTAAILLGNDDEMDEEVKRAYSAAGTSHILCVSGMHVGIIYMLINFLLKFLDKRKSSKRFKMIVLVFIIWFYSCITGLSPSVQRAACMFSFVSFGHWLQRNSNVFHSLFTSLFILLLINPSLIFEVGFQLSYAAVFGIVMFQGKICRLWKTKNKVLHYFWELATVSIAAQLGTFPIAVYYFGQFPNYFLISNLSVILLSFIIVINGIAVLVFSFSTTLASFLSMLLNAEVKTMNTLVRIIEQLPGSVSEGLYLHLSQVFTLYICILCSWFYMETKQKIYFWIFCMNLVLFSVFFMFAR